jgi:hypothetical protein
MDETANAVKRDAPERMVAGGTQDQKVILG